MNVLFRIPKIDEDTINNVTLTLADNITNTSEKEQLSGQTVLEISAIVVPVVWALIELYLPRPNVTIEFTLDNKNTVTVSDRNYERAKKKTDNIKAEWEKERQQRFSVAQPTTQMKKI